MTDNLSSFDENADRYFHGYRTTGRVHVTRAVMVSALICTVCHLIAILARGDVIFNLLALSLVQIAINEQGNRICLLVYLGICGLGVSVLGYLTFAQVVSTLLMATRGRSTEQILNSSIMCALLTVLVLIGIYVLKIFGNFYHYITMRERASSVPEKTQPAPEIIVASMNSGEEPPAYSEKIKIEEEEEDKPPAYSIA